MSDQNLRDAASYVVNSQRHYGDMRRSQSHSINFITEDYLSGFRDDGRMSVVRRFFCLFVTFDFIFTALLWLICVMISGDNIYNALDKQVIHYTIYTSLFDIVLAGACRFTVLISFYALLYINNPIVIALSTSGSCLFLIVKVFYFDWKETPEPVFEVLLILVSFVLSWGEAWFLDCRVIPQERHASQTARWFTGQNDDRARLVSPFHSSHGPPENDSNFYSPIESGHNSDEEEDEDDEYKRKGNECVRKACELLESTDWKIQKITSAGDRIEYTNRPNIGKIYKLTGRVNCSAKVLLNDLFYKIEDVPKWNPTLLESKIIRKIDEHTDISYQATIGGGGGMVKSRDFCNLRCWQLCRDGKIVVEEMNSEMGESSKTLETNLNLDSDTDTDEECLLSETRRVVKKTKINMSSSSVKITESVQKSSVAFNTLSKSLGAKDFLTDQEPYNSGDDELIFSDAQESLPSAEMLKPSGNIYVSAAVSVEYPSCPVNPKYIRGENIVSCWAMREIGNKEDWCIFEWLLCIDLKGYITRYVLDNAYSTLMQDYMTYLRKYCDDMKEKKS